MNKQLSQLRSDLQQLPGRQWSQRLSAERRTSDHVLALLKAVVNVDVCTFFVQCIGSANLYILYWHYLVDLIIFNILDFILCSNGASDIFLQKK